MRSFPSCEPTIARPRRLMWLWALLLAMAAVFLLHGCHGPDEDHELFGTRGPEKLWILD